MNIFIHIKKAAPNVFEELLEFIQKKYSHLGTIEHIQPYLAIAIMLDYMNENAIEMSLSDISITTIEDEIITILTAFEETTKHYS